MSTLKILLNNVSTALSHKTIIIRFAKRLYNILIILGALITIRVYKNYNNYITLPVAIQEHTMTLRLAIAVVLFITSQVFAGKSPNGEQILKAFPDVRNDIAEDAKADVVGLLLKYGYPFETHVAQTEDGYLLTMHRITGTKGETVTPESLAKKPIVFVMHGLLSSSADWLTAGVDVGLGYLLADQGFDVWMGNARGNYYSKNHISLNPKNDAFWKFSWDEIGYFDLPAMINKALAISGKSKLHYIGHSQGTTSFFVMTSRRPEYNSKIKSMHALAPVAYMSNLSSPLLRLLAPFANTIGALTSLIGMNELLPNNELMTIAGDLLCKDNSFFQPVCSNILFLLCGFNHELHNSTLFPVILGHTPAGSSSRQLIHYGQEINSGKFRRYDHGRFSNLLEYGSLSPPNYDLHRITAPVFLHYSDNDWMADVGDVRQLNRELGNSIGMFRIPHAKFNHLDFLWAINIRSLLYNRVVELMKQFE